MLKVKNVGRKHWSDLFGWGMVEVMHSVLLNVTKIAFAFLLMKSQQLIIFNGCPSICMLSKLRRGFPILFCVETIGVLATSNNIFVLMVEACLDFGGLRL
jgi:hypothetical protein